MENRPTKITEEELERLFRDDPMFAVEMLDADYRENIWRYIRSICRYFSDDEIHDVYMKALREFIKCVKKPSFDPHSPFKLIQRIAKFRAIDVARQKKKSKIRNAGDLIEPLAVDLKDTKLSLEWRTVLKEEWPRFRKSLDEAIEELPEKQKVAALAFLEVYEEMRRLKSPRPLADRIREMTSEDCTAATAADRWREARRTIEAKLTRAGFRSLFEEMQ